MMLHMHLLGLLSFEVLVLIASLFFLAYATKNGLEKRFIQFGRVITIFMHIVILATIIHAIVFHFSMHNGDHMHMMMQHMHDTL